MKKTKALPDQKRLKDLLEYDCNTGILTWKHRDEGPASWNARWAGKIALDINHNNGYRYGYVDNVAYLTHRVIFKWLYNREPPQIDHINGFGNDNRACNLRASSNIENSKNAKRRKDNSSGHCGVYYRKDIQKWVAEIMANGQKINIGCFVSVEGAIAARLQESKKRGFSKRHGTIHYDL